MSDLRAFYERWERLEAEKAAIACNLKELFAEAKASGFDPKAMRIAFRQKVRSDNESGSDRELAATVSLYLDAIETSSPVHLARESAPARTRGADMNARPPLVAPAQDEGGVWKTGDDAAREADTGFSCIAQSSPFVETAGAGEGVEPPIDPAPASDVFHSVKTARDYRPHCRRPESCGSDRMAHCFSCARALELESAQ